MLKLLRVENTNTFIVASEEDFVKSMKIEGFVRIERDYPDDDIKVFEPKDADWHEQVCKLKAIKRKELYLSKEKEKKIIITLKTILIHYFNETSLNHISVRKLCSLAIFIYEWLESKNKLEKYTTSFDLDLGSIERILLYNSDVFTFVDSELEMNSFIYCFLSPQKIGELAKELPLDEIILDIIRKYY